MFVERDGWGTFFLRVLVIQVLCMAEKGEPGGKGSAKSQKQTQHYDPAAQGEPLPQPRGTKHTEQERGDNGESQLC